MVNVEAGDFRMGNEDDWANPADGGGPGKVIEDLTIDLPRPRPLAMGKSAEFADYSDHIYRTFSELGVLNA